MENIENGQEYTMAGSLFAVWRNTGESEAGATRELIGKTWLRESDAWSFAAVVRGAYVEEVRV